MTAIVNASTSAGIKALRDITTQSDPSNIDWPTLQT